MSELVNAIFRAFNVERPELNSLEGKLLVFLLCNYAFLLFEIVFGSFINSLGLVCDGVHMFINCFGITISWIALQVSKTSTPTTQYTYGFGRMQVLAGFTNAIFLVFVALFLVFKAIDRLFQPVDIHANHALTVAFSSFLLNFFGLVVLRLPKNGSEIDVNMQGVFVHLKSDLYSSVGVIISSVSVRWREWIFMDAVVSMVILGLIVYTAIPLLIQSTKVLLQTTPKDHRIQLDGSIREIEKLPGVIECHEHHFWTFSQGVFVATIKIRVRDDASRDAVLIQAYRCLLPNVAHATIQIVSDTGMMISKGL